MRGRAVFLTGLAPRAETAFFTDVRACVRSDFFADFRVVRLVPFFAVVFAVRVDRLAMVPPSVDLRGPCAQGFEATVDSIEENVG